jgi:malic enzyme
MRWLKAKQQANNQTTFNHIFLTLLNSKSARLNKKSMNQASAHRIGKKHSNKHEHKGKRTTNHVKWTKKAINLTAFQPPHLSYPTILENVELNKNANQASSDITRVKVMTATSIKTRVSQCQMFHSKPTGKQSNHNLPHPSYPTLPIKC